MAVTGLFSFPVDSFRICDMDIESREHRYARRKHESIFLPRKLLESPVFWSLPKSAVRAYMVFRGKCAFRKVQSSGRETAWVIANNGEIRFSYKEAEAIGIPATSFCRSLDELVNKGFIDIIHQGGALEGDCSLYAISDRWHSWGTDEFVQRARGKGNPWPSEQHPVP